jgi:YD repeat-containing protein
MKIKILVFTCMVIPLLLSCDEDDEKNPHRIKQIIYDDSDGNDYDYKWVFYYNNNEQLIQMIHHEKDDYGSWEEDRIVEFEYGSSVTTATRSDLVLYGDPKMLSRSEYNIQNNLIMEELYLDYDEDQWVVAWKWAYQYSGADLIGWRSYNDVDGVLKQDGRAEYSYRDGKLTEYLYEYLNNTNNWVPIDRETFSYSGDHLSGWIDFNYDNTGKWIEYYKSEYSYADGRVFKIEYYDIDTLTNAWKSEPYNRVTYDYDSNGCLAGWLDDDGDKTTYEYEEGHGNAKLFYYYPESLVYERPTLKSAMAKGEYVPYYKRIISH